MKQRLYVCNRCKDEGKEFQVPADFIGVELMKSHLWDEHRLSISYGENAPSRIEEDHPGFDW